MRVPVAKHTLCFARYLLALLVMGTLTSCTLSPSSATSSASSSTTAPARAGWSIYHGSDFALSFPASWTYSTPSAGGAGASAVVVFQGPQPRDQIEVSETTGITQAQIPDFCATSGETAVTLAGLPMRYQVVEGVHRVWTFVNGAHISFALSALDADQPQAMRTQHDAILATFQPSNRMPGCP